jgi:hypothetical protein
MGQWGNGAMERVERKKKRELIAKRQEQRVKIESKVRERWIERD